MDDTHPWPTELRISEDRDRLTVRYEEGTEHRLPAEYLRVLTPSAERKGHGARNVIGGKAAVRIADVRPVGQYAVRIEFSDGHQSGLYTFENLFRLGRDEAENWASYLAELDEHGLSRERPGTAPAH